MALKTSIVTIPPQPERTETREIGLICDLCGKESRQRAGWGNGLYEVAEVTIEYKAGYAYPDDWSHDTTVIDLCPDCFTTRLMPWLREQGVMPRVETTD